MYINSFEDRIDRIDWQPSAVPTRKMIDSMLGSRQPRQPRSAVLSLAGALTGLVIGVGLKGMVLPGSPWGPGTGLAGAAGGSLALAGLAVSVPAALFAAAKGKRAPRLMQFASMNLLMIMMVLWS
ncbi:hypothetical protein [Leisingera caerulea]|uniref:Uncharacterized protein n=1 Tax=Leisingera caerulea TaxID=506591 RepID=A0A9Q9HJA9_LEICA|nr:hypothetical protein [Leisingera caerulea]UWQ48223.1 hypothetical protein K3720_09620 [Leisingera caerulea]UWQ55743.1 hypothetical protein K3721_09420 [Leisingera caerulea]UWQ61131.1 hypothetical protein K3723_09480 [Leisingera caerulea]